MASAVLPGVATLGGVKGAAAGGPKVLSGKYEVGRKLGAGLQGQVYLGKSLESGELVALKCMDKKAIEANPKVLLNVQRELQGMVKCSGHLNTVNAVDIDYKAEWPRSNGTKKDIILLVLELCSKSELFDFAMHTGPFPEQIARHYFGQLMSALKHCHEQGVYHRDLKPENLLISEAYDLKVADFGLAAVTEDGDGVVSLLKTKCGTKGYMAPEVLARNSGYHGGPVDVWSSAVILFIMVAGFPPLAVAQRGDWWFDRIVNKQWAHFWKAHERSSTFSPAFKDLLQRMFAFNAAERASVDEVLAHEWLAGETLPAATIHAEMGRRWATVQAKKDAERSAAAQSSSGDVDLLGGAVTRGAGGPTAAPLPALPEGVERELFFFAGGSAGEVADKLAAALGGMAADVHVSKEDGAVQVSAAVGGMGVVADVFADGAAHVVEVTPAPVSAAGGVVGDDEDGEFAGDMGEFRAVFGALQAAVTGAAPAGLGALAPPPAEDAAGAEGKEGKEEDEFADMM